MLTAPRRLLTLAVTALLLVATFGNPATAEPTPGANEDGGQNLTVRQALDKATAAYNDAKGRLDKSVADQASIGDQMATTQTRLTELQASAGTIAATAYRGRRVSLLTVMVGAENPDDMLHNMVTVEYMLQQEDKQLREVVATQKQLEQQRKDIDAAVANQQAQLKIMEANKKAAEDALRKAGGGADVSSGVPTGGKVTTNPVARNSDGSYPSEGCTINDPTTSGCISPRMLNAYNEARKAGFTHYTSCHRNGGGGDHPLGKACDFSANASTFVNARATGADKTYGDNLAAWAIANAKNLGVKYVIWYKRIWQPSSGWKSYGGDGTPAGDHYNHVHISMQ
ncbi:coiled-coil domain-containing protein [Dactylosporangium sp. NPDC048998]|uniref:coiled-coil domain-containing protein n=1 Tax=Dactylosporangium sp. NPDC048998 TaxID=3363976 RepID=UPI00372019B7